MSWISNWWNELWGESAPLEKWGNDFFLFDINADFDTYTTDRRKIAAVFSNPAVLKVFKLQCDMFSLGKIYVYKKGKSLEEDPALNFLKNPNPFQHTEQWLWDMMFWKMIGNGYCYIDSDNPASETNKSYFLDPGKITWPETLRFMKDKIILSDASMKAINESLLTYTYEDGTSIQIRWDRITHISDLTNGMGNWFKGGSSIDALYEVISNSRAATKSKNITVRYAGKYMVAGQADPNDVTKTPMAEQEKQDIESKMNGRKSIHAVKSMIDIKRFVERADIISQLDESYYNDYFTIGGMYGIPRDVLEAYLKGGSTYENQEKARGAHVSYTLSPTGNQFMRAVSNRFGYKNKELVIDWEHLPFMQVFAKERAETMYKNTQSLLNLAKMGIKIDEINATLDTNFTFIDYESAKTASASGANETSSSQNNQ